MQKILSRFLVIFAMVEGTFSILSCSTQNPVWCMSNGILTYNRVTGQLEVLWESEHKPSVVVHDTVYICPDTLKSIP